MSNNEEQVNCANNVYDPEYPVHINDDHFKATPNSAPKPPPAPSSTAKRQSFLQRTFSKQNRNTAKRFFSAYAQTWIGLSPIWLMGEALMPGTKVGTQLRKGTGNLLGIAEEIRDAVSTSSQDIVVIVDKKLRAGRIDTIKTAEVLKAAGENAILVVSSSLEKAQAQLKQLSDEHRPNLRKVVASNSRDVIVVLDKALKHPIVVTGVSKFAQSKGIPHADALLRLASLGLAKILHAMPGENLEGAKGMVEEIDAEELERTSSREETENAAEIGRESDQSEGTSPKPKTDEIPTPPRPKDPYERMKNENKCVIS